MDKVPEAHHDEKLNHSYSDVSNNTSEHDNVAVDNAQEQELTVHEILKNHKTLVFWCFFWALSAIGWGFDAQVNGGMISVPAFRRDFGYIYEGQPVLPADWQTAFNVISSPGQLIGGFACSYVADKFGRRQSLLVGIILCTGGIFGQIFSTTRPEFLVSKLILGFGLGFYLTIGPLMASEITPVALRGIVTSGINLGIALGQLLSNSVIAGFGNRMDSWAYRGPFAVQLMFALVLFLGYPFAPESPFYLVSKGKQTQAYKSLERLYGTHVDIHAKLAAIERVMTQEARKEKATIADCFKDSDRLRSIISMGVFVCQHMVGIIFVLGYSSYFFQLAGLDTTHSFDLGVGVTACGVAGNIASWFFINSFGRRRGFVYGMAVLTALLFLIAIMDVVPTSAAKWVQASTTVIWNFIYFMTIGAMAFAILGETSSSRLRAPTIALATATQAVMGTAMNFAIPYMLNPDKGALKGKVGFVFGGLGLIGTVWSYLYVPELSGKTFAQIDHLFMTRVPPRKMGATMF